MADNKFQNIDVLEGHTPLAPDELGLRPPGQGTCSCPTCAAALRPDV